MPYYMPIENDNVYKSYDGSKFIKGRQSSDVFEDRREKMLN